MALLTLSPVCNSYFISRTISCVRACPSISRVRIYYTNNRSYSAVRSCCVQRAFCFEIPPSRRLLRVLRDIPCLFSTARAAARSQRAGYVIVIRDSASASNGAYMRNIDVQHSQIYSHFTIIDYNNLFIYPRYELINPSLVLLNSYAINRYAYGKRLAM